MKIQFSACQTHRSMYPSIFNSFPVIRTATAKNRRFQVPHLTFLFPLETPLRLSRNMLHGWKDNSMLAKPIAAHEPFRLYAPERFELFTTPAAVAACGSCGCLRQLRAACGSCGLQSATVLFCNIDTHLSSTVSQLFKPQVQ